MSSDQAPAGRTPAASPLLAGLMVDPRAKQQRPSVCVSPVSASKSVLAEGPKGKLIIVANRLPMNIKRNESGEWDMRMSSGGLVSALMGVHGMGWRMTWIGWPGSEIPEEERPALLERIRDFNRGRDVQCHPVFLPKDVVDKYYTGFSNNVVVSCLFPCFLVSPPGSGLRGFWFSSSRAHHSFFQWPLFHYINVPIASQVKVLEEQWEAYQLANETFADTVMQLYEEGDMVAAPFL